ncbi:hypothetical protein [Streptomyces sp. E1N211]|uniref:hypothetical protein n=1 Tax=Streptomyces sp. E1N211 TaxID=1851876 RepID=UPI0012D9D69F|nr:hypothetical protein [Streptomyces sp. E1N211]
MSAAALAQRVNQLPWETWLDACETARHIGLPQSETDKLLRAARRKGTVTVRRSAAGLQYKRVRTHPQPSQRLARQGLVRSS